MSDESAFQHIDVSGLQKLKDNPSLTIFDIRDPNSFAQGHIPGALHLHNDNLQTLLAEVDRNAPVVLCCYHGVSSQSAAEFVAAQGFSDVYSLDGGYAAWQQQES
ncbi:MAG: thiosulfate sulfurtransferase GlpE [Aestuariibacter sp.]